MAPIMATSAQPKDPYPESLAWFRVPADPHEANLFDINAKYGDVISKAEIMEYLNGL